MLSILLDICLSLQVTYLQNDNAMLENKQKELHGTIHNLLQSTENFTHAYQVGIWQFTEIFVWRLYYCIFREPDIRKKVSNTLSYCDVSFKKVVN